MDKDNGGPAFPCEDTRVDGVSRMDGMSLRDYFAAKAMQAHIGMKMYEDGELFAMEVAMHAYELADAMLKERAK